jgi:hypothetical protein
MRFIVCYIAYVFIIGVNVRTALVAYEVIRVSYMLGNGGNNVDAAGDFVPMSEVAYRPIGSLRVTVIQITARGACFRALGVCVSADIALFG